VPHELLRLSEPKPKVSRAGLLIALDAGHLGLRHLTRPQFHQFLPPHINTPPTILNALEVRRLRGVRSVSSVVAGEGWRQNDRVAFVHITQDRRAETLGRSDGCW
jgi:hypothetical protein